MSGYFKYKVDGIDEVFTYYSSDYNYDLKDDIERESLSLAMADQYYHEHEGYRADWPIHVILLDAEEKPVGKFEVDREMEPVFYSYEVE